MLQLGDIVRHRNWPIAPQPDVTIDQVFVADGVYYYRTDDCTKAVTEDGLEFVRSGQLYQQYDIGDTFITNSQKEECDYFGITDDMVPGTIDAMEVRINGVCLGYDGRIIYSYYINTPIGLLEGIIRPSDTRKHQYTLF